MSPYIDMAYTAPYNASQCRQHDGQPAGTQHHVRADHIRPDGTGARQV